MPRLLLQSGLWLAHRFSTQVAFWGGWAGLIAILPEPYPLPGAFALSLLVSFATFTAVRRRFGPPSVLFLTLPVWALYEGLLFGVRLILVGSLLMVVVLGSASLRTNSAELGALLAVAFALACLFSWWAFRQAIWPAPRP